MSDRTDEQHGVRCVFCGFDKTVCICDGASADDEGHDPDLDENGVCRVCGKYEPE